MRSARAEAGSATVWVLLASTVVWSVATWGVALASTASSRARASNAADLAALAGAADAVFGDTSACRSASRVAEANHATVTNCTVDAASRTVELVVTVDRRGLLAHAPPAMARARAGPDQTTSQVR